MIVLPQIAENASTMMCRTTPRLDQKREVNYVANCTKKSQIVCMAHVAQGVLVVAGHQWSLASMPSCLGSCCSLLLDTSAHGTAAEGRPRACACVPCAWLASWADVNSLVLELQNGGQQCACKTDGDKQDMLHRLTRWQQEAIFSFK
jgi:hypothetical protein